MTILQGITSEPKQTMAIPLADGSTATWSLEYRPNQLGWFWGLTWGTVDVQGCRLVASPNIFRQYKNLIPFGLAVLTDGNVEPMNQEDFFDGSATVYLLDTQDIADIEAQIFPGL